FNHQFHQEVTHVSRHTAPDHFIQIKYSNGRTIIVTPEHPIFVFKDEFIDEVPAEQICEGDFIPAVRSLDCISDNSLSIDVEFGRKEIKLPSKMDASLARFLGYFVSEGYSYEGSSMEVGLSNTDPSIISDMVKCIEDSFGIKPIDNTEKGRVLRIFSKTLFTYMKKNFPEVMKQSLEKRIPRKMFSTTLENKIEFLNTAFLGDGAIESEALAFSTSSEKLAYDYQDLLLNLGVHSRIHSSKYLTRKSKIHRIRYKVYILGDNLDRFVDLIIPELKVNEKLKALLNRSRKTRGHDILPPSVGHIIKRCMKRLGMPYNGYFQQAFHKNCGITIEVINRFINHIEERKEKLKQKIPIIADMKRFREISNYSQNQIAKLIENSRSCIDYTERGGYVLEKRNQILTQAKQRLHEEIEEVEKSISYLEKLQLYLWLRVTEIKRIPNQGDFKSKWVYDVTIDPIRTFVSHGIILHNTISIAKAGIVATLNARTAILAAANPRRGRWNPYKATAENLNLPPTILSRFDLIFVLEDKPDLKEDHDMASHILNLHQSQTLPKDPPINQDLLRKYIAYARREVHPRLSDEAQERLLEYYKELRSMSGQVDEKGPDSIAITPRQLEALVRLSEARAKMRLSDEVSYDDAAGAVNLMNATLEKLAKDTETGKLDIDKAFTGVSAKSRRALDRIDALIDRMLEEAEDEPVAIKDIIDQAIEEGLNKGQVVKVIDEMTRRGRLFEPQTGYIKKP
ncbi:MAG: LAGLIDADG family homing endonuclease, partial [Candidatus Hermodarchaeota archaeon]